MSNYKVASRYARSLFTTSIELSQLTIFADDLMLIDETIEASRDLRVFIKSPVIRGDKKFQVLSAIFASKVSESTLTFLKLVCRKGRENMLHEIAKAFLKLYNHASGILDVDLVMAESYGDAFVEEVKSIIERQTNKKVLITQHFDADLISGYIIKVGDLQIDLSVASELSRIKSNFIN